MTAMCNMQMYLTMALPIELSGQLRNNEYQLITLVHGEWSFLV